MSARNAAWLQYCSLMEEQHGAPLVDREVADLVHDEQGRMRQHAQAPGQIARGLGVGE